MCIDQYAWGRLRESPPEVVTCSLVVTRRNWAGLGTINYFAATRVCMLATVRARMDVSIVVSII